MSGFPSKLDQLIQFVLDERRAAGQLRQLRTVHPLDSTHVQIDGRRCVNFCSNNYLGLNHHPRLVAAAEAATRRYGAGSGSAALIGGHTEQHLSTERAIARWKQTEAAVLLPSGYQANHAAIQTLSAIGKRRGVGVRFILDKLVHASIVDAVASGEKRGVRIFPHNHLSKLKRLLEDSDENVLNVVVTESIFSMDGDAADLRGIAALKRERPFVLLLDEAHASGVYGKGGNGYAHELGLAEQVDVSIVTLSKALGGIGGAICGSELFCQAVVNFGRGFIYTTNLPASAAAVAESAIEILRDEPQRQSRLREVARRVRRKLLENQVPVLEGIEDSPIICVVLGAEKNASIAAAELLKEGLFVAAVRPPTVAAGSSRLRITLSCQHSDDELEQLVTALGALVRRLSFPGR